MALTKVPGGMIGYGIATKTTTYSALVSDDLILCSGSAFTVTLPAASGIGGKVICVRKTDSSLSNIITVARASSDTIEGDSSAGGATSTTLNTLGEEVEFISDGTSKWYIRRTIPFITTSYTPTYSASLIGGSSVVTSYADWQRVGSFMTIRGTATAGAAVTGAAMKISLPSGATALVPFDTIVTGSFTTNYTGGTNAGIAPLMLTGDTGNLQFSKNNSASGFAAIFANIMANGSLFSWTAEIPISGWKG